MPGVRRSPRRFICAAALGSLAALAVDLAMLTAGHGSLLRDTGLLGEFFDAQGRALLHGRLAVDPAAAGFEGFVTGGRTYVYFGPVPSVLRLPVLAVTNRLDGRLTQASMLLGLIVLLWAGAALHWRVRCIMRPREPLGRTELTAAFLLQLALGAGAIPLYLAASAVAYHEAELWGAALAVAALAGVVGVLLRPSLRTIAWAGLGAMLAINTRFSVGLAPVAALAVLASGVAATMAAEGLHRHGWVRAERPAAALASFAPPTEPSTRRLLLVALVAAALLPVAVYAAISEVKFHQPFALPLDRQVDARLDPKRQATLRANGGSLFGPAFVPSTLLQAVRPDAVGMARAFPFVGVPRDPPTVVGKVVFDTLEQSLSAPTSMPFLCLLTLAGFVALVRTRRWRPLLGVVVASQAGFVTTLTIAYIATRYLADYLPFLLLGGVVGLQAVLGAAERSSARLRRWLVLGLAAAVLVGVMTNGGAGLILQRLLSAESSMSERAAFIATQDDVDRLLGRRPHGVRVGSALPPRSIGAPGDLFVLDRCAALYVVSIARSWLPVERTSRSGVHPLAVRLPRSTLGREESLVTLGVRAERVTATVRIAAGRAQFGLRAGGGRLSRGASIPVAAVRSQRFVLSFDRQSAVGSVVVLQSADRVLVIASVPFDLSGAPAVAGVDPWLAGSPRFSGTVRVLPTSAPVCLRIARRAGLLKPRG